MVDPDHGVRLLVLVVSIDSILKEGSEHRVAVTGATALQIQLPLHAVLAGLVASWVEGEGTKAKPSERLRL